MFGFRRWLRRSGLRLMGYYTVLYLAVLAYAALVQ
jgi:hypothetical protein